MKANIEKTFETLIRHHERKIQRSGLTVRKYAERHISVDFFLTEQEMHEYMTDEFRKSELKKEIYDLINQFNYRIKGSRLTASSIIGVLFFIGAIGQYIGLLPIAPTTGLILAAAGAVLVLISKT